MERGSREAWRGVFYQTRAPAVVGGSIGSIGELVFTLRERVNNATLGSPNHAALSSARALAGSNMAALEVCSLEDEVDYGIESDHDDAPAAAPASWPVPVWRYRPLVSATRPATWSAQ